MNKNESTTENKYLKKWHRWESNPGTFHPGHGTLTIDNTIITVPCSGWSYLGSILKCTDTQMYRYLNVQLNSFHVRVLTVI